MIKAVFFDLDGVLTTDKKGMISTCKYLSHKTGLDFDLLMATNKKWDAGFMNGSVKYGDIWEEFCKSAGQTIEFSLLHEAFINSPIDKKMEALAFELKKIYKTGLITDNTSERTRAIIKENNWNKLFDIICVSAEVGSDKHDEKIFRRAIDGLDLTPEECVFVDNTDKNLVVPRQMGMSTILFDDEKRDYGEVENLFKACPKNARR